VQLLLKLKAYLEREHARSIVASSSIPTDLESHWGLLIIRGQGAAFREFLHVAKRFLKESVVGFDLLLPRGTVRLRGAVPEAVSSLRFQTACTLQV
jgi:hypothetical protein